MEVPKTLSRSRHSLRLGSRASYCLTLDLGLSLQLALTNRTCGKGCHAQTGPKAYQCLEAIAFVLSGSWHCVQEAQSCCCQGHVESLHERERLRDHMPTSLLSSGPNWPAS